MNERALLGRLPFLGVEGAHGERLFRAANRVRLRSGLYAVGDQALISLSNFVTLVLVARASTPREFGFFTLAFMGLLVASSVQAGVFTQAHNVLGSQRHGEAYRRYTTSTLLAQFGVAGALGMCAAALAVSGLAGEQRGLLLGFAIAAVAWQVQEYLRRVLYTEARIPAALLNDALTYGSQMAVLAALYTAGLLTPERAMLAIAGTSGAGALLGLWQVRRSLAWRVDPRALGENWRYGRWLCAAMLMSIVASQSYPYLTALAAGAAAAGALKAAQNMLGPTHVFLTALDTSATPFGARRYEQAGEAGLRAFVRSIYEMGVPVMAVYCLLVSVLSKPLMQLAYGDAYARYWYLVPFIALNYFIFFLSRPAAVGLRVLQSTRPFFIGQSIAAAWTVTGGLAGLLLFGLPGAIAGMLVNSVTINLVLSSSYARVRP